MRIGFTDSKILECFHPYFSKENISLFQPETACDHYGDVDILVVDASTASLLANTCNADHRPSLFLAIEEKADLPEAFIEGYVDDLLVLPLRAHDVTRMLRMHEYLHDLREMERTSGAIPELVKKLHDDIHLAQKIQRRLIKDKFPPMGGLSIKSKYWCGLKAGGDYFDVFEFPDGNNVGVVLSDSSSYSLSTHFLGSLMEFSVRMGAEQKNNPADIVKALYGKLRAEMKDKDRFSILYGVLNRKTYQFQYVECGGLYAFHQPAEGKANWICKGQQPALEKATSFDLKMQEVSLEPGDRLVLLSDGWNDGWSNAVESVEKLATHQDPQEILNEMAFRLRKEIEKEMDPSEISEEFPMPPQDCSILVLDVAKNVLRLAK